MGTYERKKKGGVKGVLGGGLGEGGILLYLEPCSKITLVS